MSCAPAGATSNSRSLVNTGDPSLREAQCVAETLVGAPVELRRILAAGRNSRIYRVSSGGQVFALKRYPPRRDDPRDRLSTEVGALRLMERCKVNVVPRVVGVDGEHGYALLTWIEGSQVADIADTDIDAAVGFLRTIHELRREPDASGQPPAAESCLSGAEIEGQIHARFGQLRALEREHELIDFLDSLVLPELARRGAEARAAADTAGLDFAADLSQEWQTLVPADFGFHNSLRRDDGSLAFVDFEYFGWDDPVKLTADIMLHPGKPLSASQRRRFRQAAVRLYGEDRMFEPRLAAYFPLFALRWVLILLNEFLPERWQRRLLAGDAGSWEDAKIRQLLRARAFLAALPQTVGA
jgi:Ser/Thr protein kinase RdoA (MazF antagonist)